MKPLVQVALGADTTLRPLVKRSRRRDLKALEFLRFGAHIALNRSPNMPLTGPVPKGGTFFCPHCGAMYSVTHSRLPKRDSNIAKCVVCKQRWTSGTRFLSTSSFIGLKIPDRSDNVSVCARARLTPKWRLVCYNPAFRTIGRPRLAIYSLPSIGPTCGGSRSR